MMRLPSVVLVVAVLVLAQGHLCADQTTLLKDVRYTTHSGRTKVTFAFSGDVRFSTEQGKGAVRLIFSRTRPATPGTIQRRLIPSGPLESISFASPASDSLVVSMMIVEGSTYRCVRPSSGNELFVEVDGRDIVRRTPERITSPPPAAPTATKAGTAARPTAGTQPARTSAEEPPGQASTSPLVDIPAVARRQMEPDSPHEYSPNGPSTADTQVSGFSTGFVILLSVGLSSVSTGLMLGAWYLARQRKAHRSGKSRLPRAATAFAELPANPEGIAAGDAYEETGTTRRNTFSSALIEDESQEHDNGRETSLQLARTFKRGSEEITLARRFHEQTEPTLTSGRMETVLSRATTKTQQLHAARKLGVGRGEFDLAVKLKSMGQVVEKKEDHQ